MSVDKDGKPVDLSVFFGSPDDQCPICLEAMPVVTFRFNERKLIGCCGNWICPGCQDDVNAYSDKLLAEIQSLPANSAERAKLVMQLETSGQCPLCRGQLLIDCHANFKQDLKRAKKGNANAQYQVGVWYRYGHDEIGGKLVGKNDAEAAKWFKLAADQGHPNAMDEYGMCCMKGRGVPRSTSEGIRWIEKSSAAGNPISRGNLGVFLLEGMGIEMNPTEAVRLLQLAADQDLGSAQYLLGMCYLQGNGVGKELDEAMYWQEKLAAKERPDDAKYSSLALQKMAAEDLYYSGALLVNIVHAKYGSVTIPGKCPFPRAIRLFRKAAKLGHPFAASKATYLEGPLSKICANCLETPDKLSRCVKCKVMHYCSKNCQVEHWKAGHKKDCCRQD